jgi:hypothetical protein
MYSDKNLVAPVPPRGWNSWDCFAATVTEDQLLANAAYMQEHLLPFGWEYIVCDIQWYEPLAGSGEGEYRPFAALTMDAFSRLLPAENRFPSSRGGVGFAAIAAKIHAMGLQFGIHLMRGIPRQAVHARTPIKGTSFTADQIANPFSICKWNSDMYGVDATKPGAQEYYDSLFELYAGWGVDYVKIDDICNTNMYPHAPYSGRGEIELIRRAIDHCGRPMVLSLSPGPALIEEAWHLEKHANLWRVTDDFWDTWPLLLDMFRRCELWQSHVAPGCWPDCDMLPLGKIGMGFRQPRQTRFTPAEQRTLMSLWCIFRSPLMMGGDLPQNDAWTLSLLSNREILRMHRDGQAPRQLERDDHHAVWTSRGVDCTYLALFNLDDEAKTLAFSLAGLCDNPASVTELWENAAVAPAAGVLEAELEGHGAKVYRISVSTK